MLQLKQIKQEGEKYKKDNENIEFNKYLEVMKKKDEEGKNNIRAYNQIYRENIEKEIKRNKEKQEYEVWYFNI